MSPCPECGRSVDAEINCPGCGAVLVPFESVAAAAQATPGVPPVPPRAPWDRPIATAVPPAPPPPSPPAFGTTGPRGRGIGASAPRHNAAVPRRPRAGRWFVVGVLLVGAATAAHPARRMTWSGDPCTLVSQRDATALFGVAAVSGGLPVPMSVPNCAFTATSTPGVPVLFCKCIVHSLVIALYPDFGAIWRDLSPRLQVVSRKDLSGIGDRAQLATMEHSNLEPVFVKNGTTVRLSYGVSSYQAPHLTAVEHQDQLIAMAHAVANEM